MRIIIAGAGQTGSHLAKMLSAEKNEITVIDSDPNRLAAIKEVCDVITFCGKLGSIELLKDASVSSCDLFISVCPYERQAVNIVNAMLAKQLGAKRCVARINDDEYLNYENKYLFTQMGIDLLFYPEKLVVGEICEMLRRTASTDSLDFARGKLQIAVFKLDEDSDLVDKTLGELSREVGFNNIPFRVVAVARGNDTIIPHVDTKFRTHDLLFVISRREGIEVMLQYIGKRNIEVRKLMILGGSEIGRMLALQLSKELDEIKIIENDKERCFTLSEETPSNVIVVHGDGTNTDFLLEESIKEYDAFVAVTGNTETNIISCVAAKNFGIVRTIAEIENTEYIRLAERMGVDAAINKKLIAAGRIFKFTLSNKARFVKYMTGTNAEVIEFIVAPGAEITKREVKDLNFPQNAIIGGVIRGSEAFIAVGNTRIQAYDRVAVFALPDAVKEVDKFFK